MREGILFSAGLHVGVIAMVVFGLPRLMPPEPPVDVPVAVEIVNVPEEAEAKPQPKEPPKAETAPPKSVPARPTAVTEPPPSPPEPPPPPPEAPKVVAVAPPSAPPPPSPPEPVPPPKPEPVAAARPAPRPPRRKPKPPEPAKPAEAAPVQVASAAPAPAPRHKPKAPPDAFQSLLRNLEQRRQEAEQAREVAARERAEAPRLRRPDLPNHTRETEIDRQRIAAQLAQQIRNQVAPCWNLPMGAKDAQKMRVGVRIVLNPDGTLVGRPYIIEQERMAYDPAFKAFAESAIRALQNPRCSPLRLPLESYETWREISFNFDPRELLN